MKCEQVHKKLIFYLDGELPEEARKQIEDHLASCTMCSGFLSVLEANAEIIGQERKPEVSPYFFTRLTAKMEDAQPIPNEARWLRLALPVFFSALMIAGIYGGVKIGASAGHSKTTARITTGMTAIVNDFESEPIENYLLEEL